MITKLLIANRGEIACRIARTARKMGIATVAVHSEADAHAQHVRTCDEAIAIGQAPAAESYLRAGRIIEAARQAGADAIHPGYGFLSENPDFAEAVIAAGMTWVGPPPAAIRAMGLKDASKRLMEAAGVPVTPGYHGENQDPRFLAARAGEIGFPVLIKAAAGGGGKGMRLVERAEEFEEALTRARSEAASSFGNDRVLIEKFIANPRHIEVQVFADRHGQTVHLFERDCSAQRRHQKVIEETPAPGMTEALRAAMTGAAIRAAEAVGYEGAGTVEFIVDGGNMTPSGFFFMEMNTRLQVEHPVTEAVTGVDLVDWQLRVAMGDPLPAAQADIRLTGHAVEARLYAEDPARDFMPQTGTLAVLQFPDSLAGVRVDTGVAEGDRITPHYDPMIAKLIAHAPTRAGAFARLAEALAATALDGTVTNIDFLGRLARDPDMLAGRVDTGLIARRIGPLAAPVAAEACDLALAGAALTDLLAPGPLTGWRAWGDGLTHVQIDEGGSTHDVVLVPRPAGVDAETPLGPVSLAIRHRIATGLQVSVDGSATKPFFLHRSGDRVTISKPGRRIELARVRPLAVATNAAAGGDRITAPLPGLVRSIAVAPGDDVAEGAVVAVMEAMKMEHSLRAPRAGRVADLAAAPGEQVAEGAVLVTLEPEA